MYVSVWGVGPSTAQQWYYQGMRTLDDLKNADLKNENYLNKNQKVGVALFDDLDQRMDRSEAAEIEAYVKECSLQLNNQLEVIACGSFRRGKGSIKIHYMQINGQIPSSGVFTPRGVKSIYQ